MATIHGGIGITMTKVRERYWVPRLRRLIKKIMRACHGCKRFHAKAYQDPPPGNLPTTRTQGTTPFQVLGVDFAGPIRYSLKSKKEANAYLALYACSLTRAVHLDLVKSLTAPEFIISLKRFIARRGRPELIYSDNAATFQAAADRRIDFDQWEFCVVWATRIPFLDVSSAVPPFLSHARKSKPAERKDRSQSTIPRQCYSLDLGLLFLLFF